MVGCLDGVYSAGAWVRVRVRAWLVLFIVFQGLQGSPQIIKLKYENSKKKEKRQTFDALRLLEVSAVGDSEFESRRHGLPETARISA